MNLLRGAQSRIDKARETLSRYESRDPHTAGQVRRTVGGVLIADGLTGLENPFDDNKTRPGLFGALGAVLFGVVLLVGVPLLFGLFTPDTNSETTGTITTVNTGTGSKGGAVCSLIAEFTVNGQTYSAPSPGSSSTACNKRPGDTVTVLYDSADPSRATVDEPVLNVLRWVFGGVGVLVIITGLITTVIRAASIVVGVSLWRSGSRMMRDNPGTGDSDLVNQARRAITELLTSRGRSFTFARRARDDDAAVGTPPGSGGVVSPAPTTPTGVPAASRPTAQEAATPVNVAAPGAVVAPPVPDVAPGWYLTADQRHYRWHDGTSWTEHTRPAQE